MRPSHLFAGLPVLVCATILAGSSQASAHPTDPDARHHRITVTERPGPIEEVLVGVPIPMDDTANDVLQTTAGALGGAGVAAAGVLLYRRRHAARINRPV